MYIHRVVIALTVITTMTSLALFGVAIMLHQPGTMQSPTTIITPTYDGSAASYRLRSMGTLNDELTFRTKVSADDRSVLIEHLQNTAAKRHWASTRYNEYRNLFVLPDYDVPILKEAAEDPYGWTLQNERNNDWYAPKPESDVLMPARIYINVDTRSLHFTIMGSMVAVPALLSMFVTIITYVRYRRAHRG